MAPVFAMKLLVVFLSIIIATLVSVNCQVSQMVKLLEDANDISANIFAALPQLATLLRNQTDLQNISNILLENNTVASDEMATILPQIQWILQEQLEKQDQMQNAQQENNAAGMVALQDHQRVLDQIASTLYDTETMQTSLTEIAASENQTLVQMSDTLTQTAVTQSQSSSTLTQIASSQTQISNTLSQMSATQIEVSNTMRQAAASQNQASNTLTQISHTLTQIGATQTQMSDALTQMAASQSQTSNTITQIAATQTQMANSFSQVVNLLQMQSQQLENLTTAVTNQNQILLLPDVSRPNPHDCSDLAERGNYPSGPYTITPLNSYSRDIYCDMETDAGGWTVFQKRFDGSVDFFLEWSDYETGFGSAFGEYWAGLSLMHRMTQTGTWQLRIDLEAFDGDTAYAMYDSFSVGNATSNYQLQIGTYHGTAGDSLAYHNGMAFSTKDRDNDADGDNCAQDWKGAWWYNSCQHSNLNALYLGPTGNSDTANRWGHWKHWKSLKRSEMKMRRVQ